MISGASAARREYSALAERPVAVINTAARSTLFLIAVSIRNG
jgi:hypothetical protein